MGHHHHFHGFGHVFHEIEHAALSTVEHFAEHEVLSLAENGAERLVAGTIGAIL